jgi:L,D-transpeptidase YbiS
MAVNRFARLVLLPSLSILAVVLFMIAVTHERPVITADGVNLDTLATNLPPERARAVKLLRKARHDLDALEPHKPYIVIDTHANRIYLRTMNDVLLEATCSTGSGSELTDPETGRKWVFNTPRGVFQIKNKITQPWWRKPDWAFIQDNEPIPDSNDERMDPNVMGDYAMGFGDGYFIHGTLYERLLGVNVTHGCVRLGSDDLKKFYERTPIGTYVYIF